MKRALRPPITSAPAGFERKIVWWTSGLPVTSMMRSARGSVTNSLKSIVTGMLKRRANSMPGAHGLTSATPKMETVAPTMTTLVTDQTIPSAAGTRPVRRSEGLGLAVEVGDVLEARVLGQEHHLHRAHRSIPLLADDDLGDVRFVGRQILLVHGRSVQEEDEVSILLEGSRLAQVAELRPEVPCRP